MCEQDIVVAVLLFLFLAFIIYSNQNHQGKKKEKLENPYFMGCFKAGSMDGLIYNGIQSSTPDIVPDCQEAGRWDNFKYVSIADYVPHMGIGACRGSFEKNMIEVMPKSTDYWIDPDGNKVGAPGTDCVYRTYPYAVYNDKII